MTDLTKNSNDLQEILNILANKVDSSTLQPKTDVGLETNDITIVGAINELNKKVGEGVDTSNLATVDKITAIDTNYDEMETVSDDGDGISWRNRFCISVEDEELEGTVLQKIPLVAGENVTFEVEGNIVKINSPIVNIIADNTTTLQDIVDALLENNKDIYAPNLISVNSGKALVATFTGETGGMYTISDPQSGRTFQSGNNYANVILYDLIYSYISYYDNTGKPIYTTYNTIESAVSNLLKDVDSFSTALDSAISLTDSIIGGNS